MDERLYHVSNEYGVKLWEPRYSEIVGEPVVWAIDYDHLCNYLLPRDCPRVTYRPGPDTTVDDVLRLMPGPPAERVIAIEKAWMRRILDTGLFIYEFEAEDFELYDRIAGYYISRTVVGACGLVTIHDSLEYMKHWNVELRVLDSLWELYDDVVASTMDYSIIRMRNASPR